MILNISYNIFKIASDYNTVYYYSLPNGYFAGCGTFDIVYTSKITESANITDFETNILPAAIEVDLEDDVIASPTLNQIITTTRYDILDTAIYKGVARQGALDSDPLWTITKTILTSGSPTSKVQTKTESAVWNDRLTELYI